jgi:hypothetical protein
LYREAPVSMLALPVPRKESVMSEQLPLFSRKRPAWIARFWQTIDPKRRREVVAILAQMASDALTRPAERQEKEHSDER